MSEKIKEESRRVALDAIRLSTSDDPLVQIAWIIHGLDLWHRTGRGPMGHDREQTVEYVISRILRREEENHDKS